MVGRVVVVAGRAGHVGGRVLAAAHVGRSVHGCSGLRAAGAGAAGADAGGGIAAVGGSRGAGAGGGVGCGGGGGQSAAAVQELLVGGCRCGVSAKSIRQNTTPVSGTLIGRRENIRQTASSPPPPPPPPPLPCLYPTNHVHSTPLCFATTGLRAPPFL